MKNHKIITIGLPLLIIVAGVYFVWSKNPRVTSLIQNFGKKNTTQNQNEIKAIPTNDSQTSEATTEENSTNDISVSGNTGEEDASNNSPDEKRSNEKPDENFRQQIITYVNNNLNKLVSPPANDKWDVPTFYFVGNSDVYLELYAVDTDLAGAKILYKAEKDNNSIKLSELARYKEGEEDWILSQGEDNFDNYVMEEYDYNDDTKKWEKTDEFTDESYSSDNTESSPNQSPIVR